MPLAALSVLMLLVTALVSTAAPAAAEISTAPKSFWGVDGLGASATTNVEAHVWAIEQIGNTIYVGGRFTQVAGGSSRYAQPYLAAFHADTGKWIDWWRPEIDAPVFALHAAPDGSRLFVGGEFSRVNGQSATALVALDPATGQVDPTWPVRAAGGSPANVRAFDLVGDHLYLGGGFTSVGGQPAYRAAKVNWSTGAVAPDFKPVVLGGGVWGIAANPELDRVYLTGLFDSVNGSGPAGVAYVSDATGETLTGLSTFQHNNTGRQYAHDVVTVNGLVFIGGSEHFLNVYRESDMTLVRSHFTNGPGGDFQDIEVVGDRVYATCHCWGSHWAGTSLQLWDNRNAPQGPQTSVRGIMAYSATTGEKIDSFVSDFSGQAGPWAVHGNSSDGCLWIGGDMTISNSEPIKRLARLCDEAGAGPAAGPQLQPPLKPLASCYVTRDGDDMIVSWTAALDDGAESYVIRRSFDGSDHFWLATVTAPGASFVDQGPSNPGTYSYTVEARLGAGASAPTLCGPDGGVTIVATNSLPVASCYAIRDDAGITISWTPAAGGADDAESYVIRRSKDGGTFFWSGETPVPATSWTNIAPSPATYRYTVQSKAGATVSTATTCGPADGVTVVPLIDVDAPEAPLDLRQTTNSKSTISLTWSAAVDNVGVVEYRIYRDGELLQTSTDRWFTDKGLPEATSYLYEVTALDAAGNESARAAVTGSTIDPSQDDQSPTAPTSLREASDTDTQIVLTWQRSTDNIGVTEYRVYRDGTFIGAKAGVYFTDRPLLVNTQYSYTVTAVDAAGNESASASLITGTTDTEAPIGAFNLRTSGQVKRRSVPLAWDSASDNFGVVSYEILRDGSPVGTTTGTSFTDRSVNGGFPYTYSVRALDEEGNFAQSPPLTVNQ